MKTEENNTLSGVAETLFIPLYIRANETRRPDALLKDEKAVALVEQGAYDFTRIKKMKIDEHDKVTIVLRNRQFDHYVRDFLDRFPESVVVHIGCGLDSRFERTDNGKVVWYDLDVPEVIEIRRKLVSPESNRYHYLPFSAFDTAWMKEVTTHSSRPFLFLAEGVLMYFEESQVKSLVLALRDHFPGSELVFDAFSPFIVWANNKRIAKTKIGARYLWSLKRGRNIEAWGNGIRLIDEWFFLDRPEPRLAKMRWLRFIPLFARAIGIYRYHLG
jgi:methyltransferase (TIGR00027 family)